MNHISAMSNQPVFSVIMPCYNSEAYVRGAIESITSQSYPHWELVAVNDGSKDSTPEILRAYAAADERIKVYSKENGGYISAVNLGLEKVTGDYFLMMGSDDALAVDLFEQLSRCAQQGMPDVIAFRSVIVQDGKNLGVESITDFTGSVSQFNTTYAEYARTYPSHAEILSTRDTSKCYKRALLGDLRYFGRYGYDADGIFSMLLCHKAHSFAAVPVNGYFWTLRGDSLSGRKTFFAQDCDRVENWTKFYEQLLTLEASQITAGEQQYLRYFLDIIQNTWLSATPFFSQLTLVRRALQTIRETAEKTGFDLSLAVEGRLLLRFPVLWKVVMSSRLLQSLLAKLRKLAGKEE